MKPTFLPSVNDATPSCNMTGSISGSYHDVKGRSLLNKLVDLEEWSQIHAVSRSELPISSSKITQINVDLNDKDVRGFPYSLRQSAWNLADPALPCPLCHFTLESPCPEP